MKRVVSILAFALLASQHAYANNGTGSQDFCERHCGEYVETACQETVCPVTICPQAPSVQCKETTVNVTCPAVSFPKYKPCKVRRDGTLRCPHRKLPRRVLVPIS